MWKQIYEKVLSMCEKPIDDELAIVEVEQPKYSVDLIENENANENSLYAFKLDEGATEDDYKMFSEYIYNYVGLDIYDYLPKDMEEESEDNMEEQKIRELLKKYGADENEIENFMQDLADTKEDVKDLDVAKEDETKGQKEYQEMKDTNNDDSMDEKLEEIKDDEEEHEDYLLNEKTLQILKQTKEGQDLIINAPKMAKEELKQAIVKFLQK